MKLPCDQPKVQSDAGEDAAPRNSGKWILAATILGSSMAFIDGTIVNVAVPKLQSAFQASVVDVQWVIESYGLFLSALILVGGALGDALGRRLVFLAGAVLFAVASIACGLSPSIHVLIVARAIQGIGAALLVPGSLSIISASFDEDSRGGAIGIWSGFTAITMALGPVLGGWIIEHVSWRWAFFLNVPLAVGVLAISLRYVPESRNPEAGGLDWLGATLGTVSLGALITGLLESSREGWRSPLVMGTLGAALILLPLFLLMEARVSSPMVSFSLFRSKAFLGANLLTLLLYAAISIFFFLFPVTLMQVHGYSATAAGAASLPVILLMFLLSQWSGNLAGRYGGKIPLMVGPLIVAAGFALFAVFAGGGSYWKTFFPATMVLGLGLAVTVAPLTTVVMGAVDKQHSGAASGINNAVARVAGVLAIAVLGIVLVKDFSRQLDQTLPRLGMSSDAVQEIQAKEIQLVGMEIPKELDAHTAKVLRSAISEAFLSAFRLVLVCCGGLAVASSCVSGLFVPRK